MTTSVEEAQTRVSPDRQTTQRTPLHPWHLKLGASMVNFNGWDMPIAYEGILVEHRAVRSSVGIFDISHMGTVDVLGLDALDVVQDIITNDAARLTDGRALYSPICHDSGGILDDVLVYRLEEKRYRFVINAGNREKDLQWIVAHAQNYHAQVRPMSDQLSLVAVQGPNSRPLIQELLRFDFDALEYYSFFFVDWKGQPLMVSRTGYTGELGYELFAPTELVGDLWAALLESGKRYGVKPVGLGARDTLRMEMGYCLYGHEIGDTITPLDAGLAWTVGFGKASFVGRDALLAQQKRGLTTRLVGLLMLDKAIPRAGCDIVQGGKTIGKVTSGGFSPSLQCGIAMGFVPSDVPRDGHALEICVRQTNHPARTARMPFYTKNAADRKTS